MVLFVMKYDVMFRFLASCPVLKCWDGVIHCGVAFQLVSQSRCVEMVSFAVVLCNFTSASTVVT